MSNNQKGHPHAESMLLYAQDAFETDKPWERWEYQNKWEYQNNSTDWEDLSDHPSWHKCCGYRRKPQTILVNGIEVPEPVRKPLKESESYWLAVPTNRNRAVLTTWLGDADDAIFLHNGLVHLTKEAAVLHAEAMLKPSTNNS